MRSSARSPGRCAGSIVFSRLIGAGADVFIEVGPGKVLCGLMRQIDPTQITLNVEDFASFEKTRDALANGKSAAQ